MRTSDILVDILKAIFPNSEKIELHEEEVEFCLHGFESYISTVGIHGIGIDMSWYKYIRQYGEFADEMDQECRRIIEYLNIKEPTIYDRVDYVYPFKLGYMKVFFIPMLKRTSCGMIIRKKLLIGLILRDCKE